MDHQPEAFSDFEELANWLVEIGSFFSPSEGHGAIVGALSGGMRLDAPSWHGFFIAILGVDPQQYSEQQLAIQRSRISAFAEGELAALTSAELDFHPYLPDDDVELEQRTGELGAWCKGFLGGFAESQLHRKRSGDTLPDKYPENVMEAIKDLTEIARVGRQQSDEQIDDDAVYDDVQSFDPLMSSADAFEESGAAELDERDFLEVAEYVRLAALTVFTEYGWLEASKEGRPESGAPASGKPPVVH